MTEFTVLPRECQTGTCDHDPGRCVRFRSRRCLSGECTHARQGLACGAAPAPTTSATDHAPQCGRCGSTPAEHIGWAKGHLFIRRMSYQTTTPEVQPHGAGATDDTTLPSPYCYAAERLDCTPPRTLAWGRWTQHPGPITTMRHAANYEAARARADGYAGPLRVYVWAPRDDERYGNPPPRDAYRHEYGPPVTGA